MSTPAPFEPTQAAIEAYMAAHPGTTEALARFELIKAHVQAERGH